jgi:alanine racemase
VSDVQAYRSWVEVDLDHFAQNGEAIRRLVGPGVKILQVVKADAYGHGAIEIANVALRNGASCLGVANADEGAQLRISGVTHPIVILSPSPVGEIGEILKYNLTPSLSDLLFAHALEEACRKANRRIPVHIEVDTGMGRGGILCSEAPEVIKQVVACPHLQVEGIFSHLASSEHLDEANETQWLSFQRVLEALSAAGIAIPLRHMSNSGAILNYRQFDLDMVRPGLMSYGIYPSPETRERAELLPVMSFKTRVVLLKDFPAGYSIGYNRTYITSAPTTIATIPVGYGDGYGLILSNQGEALVRGCRVPVVGRVSMDMCTLDVTRVPGCRVGDEVVLLGEQGKERITVTDVAERVKTNSYEILCTLGKRAPRIFLQKGRENTVLPRLRRIYVPGEEKSVSRIDAIIRQCFQTRARSEEVGDAIYREVFENLFGKEGRQLELRENFRYDISVAEFSEEEIVAIGRRPDFLRVTTLVEYRKVLKNDEFIIGCAFDNDQLAALFEDPRCEYRWVTSRGDDPAMERDFRVVRVRIDGRDVPIVGSGLTDRGYEVRCGAPWLKEKRDQEVDISIETFTRKSKGTPFFSVYLVYPTRGLRISFNYEKARFRHVREISFFAGKHPYPDVRREFGKSITLTVRDDAWIFPNSGVTFVWET